MISIELLEEVVLSQRKDLHRKSLGLDREEVEDFPVVQSHSLIISGIRRSGKSTVLVQMLKNKYPEAFYVNFEDPRLYGFEVGDFQKVDLLISRSDSRQLLFDEIQVVAGWERYIRQKLDQEINQIVITGSNATLLSKELGTKLTGRHIAKELFPFSFNQFCQFKKLQKNKESTLKYIGLGGFPEYLKVGRQEILHQLLDDLLVRDITVRYGVRDMKSLQNLTIYLMSNVSKPVSGNNLSKVLEIKATSTVMEYLSYLEEIWLFFFIPKFSYSQRKQLVNPKKVYAIDTGMISANSRSLSEDLGRKFENLVFLHLRRKYHELYYFSEDHECDFVVFDKKGLIALVQVCSRMTEENMRRELGGLWEAMRFFGKKESMLVTIEQTDFFQKDGFTIKVIPFHEL